MRPGTIWQINEVKTIFRTNCYLVKKHIFSLLNSKTHRVATRQQYNTIHQLLTLSALQTPTVCSCVLPCDLHDTEHSRCVNRDVIPDKRRNCLYILRYTAVRVTVTSLQAAFVVKCTFISFRNTEYHDPTDEENPTFVVCSVW